MSRVDKEIIPSYEIVGVNICYNFLMLAIISNLFLLAIALFLVIKSADFAIVYSTRLAKGFHLPTYVIGFIIVAIISILPETFIATSSALDGIPAFGLGTLFGSNVADLTLVFALVILISGRNLKVESKFIKQSIFYILIILIPLIFGLNGYYSRVEGAALIMVGLLFYLFVFKNNRLKGVEIKKEPLSFRNLPLLLISMAVLLFGAQWTVYFGVSLSELLQINPALVGMLIVGLGTTIPELLFSVRAAKSKYDSLALGDILGTVIADATIVVGVVAMISPFQFDQRIVFLTGSFMLMAIIILIYLLKTGKVLTKREALALIIFYLLFVLTELRFSFY